ncbi:Inhibitor of growth protein [Aphelenchoides fujianensis]|nr:Inhibitor of growth protein [Aphelenchoides fujianensis]
MHFLDDNLELAKAISPVFNERVREIQELDKQIDELTENVKAAKRLLFSTFASLSKEEVEQKAQSIKDEYKRVRELAAKKYELSSDLEMFMDRVNHKVKKDVLDFRFELETENPGCTHECERRFVEDDERRGLNARRGRGPNRRGSSIQRSFPRTNGHGPSSNRSGPPKHEKRSAGRPPKNMKKLAINTSHSRNWLSVNGHHDRFSFENSSASSSFRPSPVSGDHSPTPSSSRLSYTPGPVSPAVRQTFPSGQNQNANFGRFPSLGESNGHGPPGGVAMSAGHPASFQINSPLSGSTSPQPDFDPVSTAMPSFAGVNESRHGRPRKLTSRVKQMLNSQKTHRPGHPSAFGNVGQYISPLSTQGFSAAHTPAAPKAAGSSGRPRGRPKLKRSPVVVDEESVDELLDDEDFPDEPEVEDEQDADYAEDEADVAEEDSDNKPYCVCRQPSYGEMIACESPNCTFEWFHLQCVGLSSVPLPSEKWFCPMCQAKAHQRAA